MNSDQTPVEKISRLKKPDQAVADVLAFLQSLPGPRNPKDIAILGD